MHAVAAFFASIVTFVSGLFAPPLASNFPPDIRASQPAAAAQAEIIGDPFNDPAAASAVAAAIPATVPASAFSSPPAPTVINQPVIERIIERVVPQGGTISAETLAAILGDFEQSISNRIAAINPPKATIPVQVAAAGNVTGAFFPASQRIDQITNTAINTPAITGGTISGASIAGYLPLSGGSLSGTLSGTDLTLSGALSAGALNVASIASAGALTGPYFTATSTTATSTLAGGFSIGSNFVVQQGSGYVGIGTTSPATPLSVNGNITIGGSSGRLLRDTDSSSLSLVGGTSKTNSAYVQVHGDSHASAPGVVENIIKGTGYFRINAAAFGGSSATELLRFTSGGALGIGTTTPWGKLSITGSGTGTGLAFAVADSANTPRFVIQDNGNVGIGTTTPATALQVQTALPGIQIGNGASNSGAFLNFAGALTAKNWRIANRWQVSDGLEFTPSTANGGTTFNTPAVVFKDSGNVGIGTTTPWGKLSITGSGTGTGLAFAVADSANTPRFSILDNGNVGIGNTSPQTILDIGSNTYQADALVRVTTGNGSNSRTWSMGTIYGGADISGRNYDYVIRDEGASADRFLIDFITGNVGIGTTNPGSKLEVQGTVATQLFNATSTTGTSTIALGQGFTIGGSQFVVQQGSGNVGIGTNTPTTPLSIQLPNNNRVGITQTSLSTGYNRIDLNNTGGASTLGVADSAGVESLTGGLPYAAFMGSNNATPLQLITNQTARVTVDSSGNIGIGTTTPGTKLDVFAGGNGVADAISSTARFVNTANAGTNARVGIIAGASGASILDFGDTDNVQGGVGYIHSSDYMYLLTQGAERLRITSSGNVGIGTTTPWGKLSITGSGTGTGLAFAVADSANTPRFVIQDNGNVGIGTTNPSTLFSLNGNASNAYPLSWTNNGTGFAYADSAGAGITNANPYTSGSLVYLTGNNVQFYNGSSVGATISAGTLALAGTTGTTTIAAGQGFTISGSQFVVQQGSGNVGIGASSPGARLHSNVSSSNAQATALLLQNDAANTAGGVDIDFKSIDTIVGRISSITGAQSNFGQLAFYTKDSGSLTERMRIDKAGNIGIGTTTPSSQLHVISASQSQLRVSGYSTISGASVNSGEINIGGYGSFEDTLSSKLQYNGGTGALYLDNAYDNAAGNIYLRTRTSGTPVNALTILGTGNVGIGTTTPQNLLSVYGGNSNAFVDINSLNGQTGFSLQRNGATKFNIYNQPVSASSYYLALHSANTGTGLDIDYTTGNVGIGTTTPAQALVIQNANHQLSLNYDNTTRLNIYSNASQGVLQAQTDGVGYNALLLNPSGGNVGVGTASPTQKLDVAGNIRLRSGNSAYFYNGNDDNYSRIFGGDASNNYLAFSTNSEMMRITNAGNVGIGTTSPSSLLHISSTGNAVLTIDGGTASAARIDFKQNSTSYGIVDFDGTNFNVGNLYVNGATIFKAGNSERMRITSSGNVGIGTTTPTAQLSTTGTVRFAGLGSGGANLVTDALGNVTVSSDERLKDKQGDFTRGLAAVNALSPVLYKWRPETGFDTQSTYAGFFAQNVQAAIPEAVSQDSRGYLTLADRPILAALVNATKEIGTIAGAFKSSLIAWLGNADNGIGDLFAKDIYATNATFNRVTAQALCAEDICVTRDQLAAVLAVIGQTSGSPSASAPTGASHAPAIELNGNASSTIEIGDTYNDLGARIIAPESDINLGIVIVLDRATTTAVSIDTSTPGEHTIIYTVTSPTSGLTGSIMRTVIISPAEQSPSPEPANDNPFNAAPANDNASSTSVLIVEPTASI